MSIKIISDSESAVKPDFTKVKQKIALEIAVRLLMLDSPEEAERVISTIDPERKALQGEVIFPDEECQVILKAAEEGHFPLDLSKVLPSERVRVWERRLDQVVTVESLPQHVADWKRVEEAERRYLEGLTAEDEALEALKEIDQQAFYTLPEEEESEGKAAAQTTGRVVEARFGLTDWKRVKRIRLTPDGMAEVEDSEGEIYLLSNAPRLPEEALVGVIGEYVNYLAHQTEIPRPFAFATLRNMLGLAIGRGLYVPYGNDRHYPIFYDALIAPSAFGRKDTAIRTAYEVIDRATRVEGEKRRFVTIAGVGSGEGLLDRLAGAKELTATGEAVALLKLGEFALLLDKAQQQATRSLLSQLNDLWTCPSIAQLPTRGDPIEVEQPTLAIMAGSALANIIETLGKREIEGGFVNRFCWWLTEPEPHRVPLPNEIPENTLNNWTKDLRAVLDFACRLNKELRGRLPIAEDAVPLWTEFYNHFRDEFEEEGRLSAAVARIPEQIWRHTIIFAVLLGKDRVDSDVLKRAIAVGNYLKETAKRVLSGLEETETRRLQRRMISVLGRAAEAGISKRDFLAACKGYYREVEDCYGQLERLARLGLVELLGE